MRKRLLGILLAICCVAGLTLMGCQGEPESELTEEEIYWNEYNEVMENYNTEKVVYTIDQDLELPYAKARQLDDRSDFRKGLTLHLDTIEFTSMTVYVYGDCEYDPLTEKIDNMGVKLERINYSDGTSVETIVPTAEDEERGYGYNIMIMDPYDDGLRGSRDTRELFGDKIDVENIESITIDGVEFLLNGGGQ